ncbi:hypothetical protein GTP41_05490 [Pseudoduganella sp. DS3]|uniref:Uncharacterized protein n=1 Tax=Pseudoduganella guangdongensis TaxID=2692179 RepID=A0A6N9HDM2_9BURK|nr:hypothetical protein [Pseudoduganella guangdongensis]MYN01546.1 hypothetical protein [Pseudoduganella guangdongensis]
MSEFAPTTASHDDAVDLKLEPFSNLLREFYRLTGSARAASLDDQQISQLLVCGREVDRHHLNEQTILVLGDDWLQRLIVIKNAHTPHFAFVDT